MMDLFNWIKLAHRELEIKDLQERIAEVIEAKADIKETSDRRIREVDHMLGLERKRHAMEVEEAARAAVVDLERQMLREKDRHMETMLNTIEKHHNEIISRLPTVHVDRQIKSNTKNKSSMDFGG